MAEETESKREEITRLGDLLFATVFGVTFALKLNALWGSGIIPLMPSLGLFIYFLYSFFFILLYWYWTHRSKGWEWLGILGAIIAMFAPFVAYGLALGATIALPPSELSAALGYFIEQMIVVALLEGIRRMLRSPSGSSEAVPNPLEPRDDGD